MKVASLPDVTLTSSAAQQLSTTSQPCKWFQINGVTVASTIRLAGSNVGASRGAPLFANGGQFSPPIADALNMYDLADVWVAGSTNDVLSVIYAV